MLCYWSLFSLCPSGVTIEQIIALVRLFSAISAVLKKCRAGVKAPQVLEVKVQE